jgi:hypothetical protein
MTDTPTPTPAASAFGLEDAGDDGIAHEIASRDPLTLAGPVSLVDGDNVRLPKALPITALSPDMRGPIEQRLSQVTPAERPALEARLVAEALAKNSLQLRVSGGGGEGTDPYWREVLGQERRQQELNKSIWDLETQLADATFETTYDDYGRPQPKAVERIQGHRRKEMEAERDRLHGELQDLNGRGGQLKLQKAMQAAVNARKEVERQLAEQAEAKQQAETMVRQERVDRMADAFAKRHRTAV